MGKTLGEMTPEERDAAIKRAASAFQAELDATAGAIGDVLESDETAQLIQEAHERGYKPGMDSPLLRDPYDSRAGSEPRHFTDGPDAATNAVNGDTYTDGDGKSFRLEHGSWTYLRPADREAGA